ncbi:MAG: sulfatase [Candidatus Altiarchaeota archaeon]
MSSNAISITCIILLILMSLVVAHYILDYLANWRHVMPSARTDKRQNVVLISIETLRPDHMSIYGYYRNTTPNIDSFFRDKTVFENAVSSAPCTMPSVARFLSGRFGYDEGVGLAQFMKEGGYNTVAVVSQHHFMGEDKVKHEYGRGFMLFDIQGMEETDLYNFTNRTADVITQNAIKWLEDNREDSFFMWLHYYDPHDPYYPPEGFRDYVDGRLSRVEGFTRERLEKAEYDALSDDYWGRMGDIFSSEEVDYYNALYDGEVRYTDFQIGRFLEYLESHDLTDNTIVVLTSDHGEHLGEGNKWNHCQNLDEYEIWVPLMFSVGGGKLGDIGHSSKVVSTLDIAPTILKLLGIDYEQGVFDGENILDTWENRSVFAEWKKEKIVRIGDYKMHHNGKAIVGLYNITSDRWEKENLISEESDSKKLLEEEMSHFMSDIMKDTGDKTKILEELHEIGYI